MVAKVSSAHSFINGRQELPTHTFILSPGQNQESWEALSQLKTTTLYGRGDRLGICQEFVSTFLPIRLILIQCTFNCGILVSGVGGSGNPWRKWEEMGEREREKFLNVLLLFAKWSKRTIEMLEVYILPLKKPGLQHLSGLSKKSNKCFERK